MNNNNQTVIHLFDDKNIREEWTDLSREYDQKIHEVLKPIVEEAAAKGHSLRDLHYIITTSALDLTLLHGMFPNRKSNV